MGDLETIRSTVKGLIIRSLQIEDVTPDDIADDQPLLEGEMAIDSIDVLQLVLEIERTFGVQLVSGTLEREVWTNVTTLSSRIEHLVRAKTPESQ